MPTARSEIFAAYDCFWAKIKGVWEEGGVEIIRKNLGRKIRYCPLELGACFLSKKYISIIENVFFIRSTKFLTWEGLGVGWNIFGSLRMGIFGSLVTRG